MSALRTLLVDDHAVFRRGLADLLATVAGVEIIGEAADGIEAQDLALRLKPDLILMDINMPRCDGLKATRAIKKELPEVNIVMLTVSDEDEQLFEAVKSGARGYLLKNLEPEELLELMIGVSRGLSPVSPEMARKILDEFARIARQAGDMGPASDLTAREREVLQYVTRGCTDQEIADHLCVSKNTVQNHMRNILKKLHMKNRVELAVFAVREGLVNDAGG